MLVTYASSARIVESDLATYHPGRIEHAIPATGGVKIFQTGYGLWRGSVIFGQRKGSDAAAIVAMLTALEDRQNYVELPLRGQSTIEKSTDVSAASSGVYTVTAVKGLQRGAMVRHAGRVYMVIDLVTATQIRLWPGLPITVNDTLTPATTIRARSRDAPDLPVSPNWSGPWAWSWEEYIG